MNTYFIIHHMKMYLCVIILIIYNIMLEGEMYNYGFRYVLFQGQITFHNFQLTYNILL